ncbi:MAG: thermonuclease family protein, partial [Desulfobulbus sp.]|nr:thermonuclease family protein [Desulfobulbus sp.]
AKRFVQNMVHRKTVRIDPMDTDPYRRTVALVTYRGQIVNVELVRRGLAWVYPRYCTKQPLCRELRNIEHAAKVNRVGLWQRTAPVPPWKWRQKRR